MSDSREPLGQIQAGSTRANINEIVDLTNNLKIDEKNHEATTIVSNEGRNNVESETIDWERERKDMDKMFTDVAEEQLKNLPRISKPKLFKKSLKLFSYQEEGIAWLVSQERNPIANPFVRETTLKDGTVAYYDRICRKRLQNGPYGAVKGAILADEMGLGKTIQTLGLIISSRPPVDKPQCTLIICPKSVISNWEQQIDQFVKPGSLRVAVYAGDRKKRSKNIPRVRNNEIDILLSTYETISSEFDNKSVDKKGNQLPDINDPCWARVVLDEAQTIRNPKSKVFKAVSGVAKKASYRLALTGTPFVNKPEDIYSLMNFIGLAPLEDAAYFNNHITVPIQDRRRAGLTRLRTGLKYGALRRTKNVVSGLEIVPKTVEISYIDFPEGEHKKIHDCLFMSAQAAFEASINGRGNDTENDEGINANAAQAMFEMLLRVRQACGSGLLVPAERYFRAAAIMDEFKGEDGDFRALTSKDGNRMINQLQAGAGNGSVHHQSQYNNLGNSPKINALLDRISEMAPDEKGVIFSQWTSMLDLIEVALHHAGHKVVRIDGSMDSADRTRAMISLANDNSVRFLVASLKAAGTGINLTRANVVFVMDPWWNSSTEDQAIDRCHRVGQTREVRVYRLVMKESIEERMIKIQKAKAALGEGSMRKLSRDEEKMAKVTTLKDLFQIKSRDEMDEGDDDMDWR